MVKEVSTPMSMMEEGAVSESKDAKRVTTTEGTCKNDIVLPVVPSVLEEDLMVTSSTIVVEATSLTVVEEESMVTSSTIVEEAPPLKVVEEESMVTPSTIVEEATPSAIVEEGSMVIMPSTVFEEATPLTVMEDGPSSVAAPFSDNQSKNLQASTSSTEFRPDNANATNASINAGDEVGVTVNEELMVLPSDGGDGSKNGVPHTHVVASASIEKFAEETEVSSTDKKEDSPCACSSTNQETSKASVESVGGKSENEEMEVDKLPSKENEDEDSDCQVIESPSSSKKFKLKQPRVLEWAESPDRYKETPSFKYNLPTWVDKFKDFFNYVKPGPQTKRAKPTWMFRCKLCVGKQSVRVQGVGYFLSHLKSKHLKQYKKIVAANPQYAKKEKLN